MSTPTDPVKLRDKSMEFLALYIACGLNPEASTLFVQSQNPHHTELAWILTSCTAYGDLTRMTQFKDKSSGKRHVTAGLLNYPILMAADILLYGTELVPIGEDQVQHLELTRSIAKRFNSEYGEAFRIPQKLTPKSGGRIRNLRDPRRKMDKSHTNARTYIALTDSADTVRSKVMKAKTDSTGNFDIGDPDTGISNLVTIMSVLTSSTPQAVVAEYAEGGYGEFKVDVAEAINDCLEPIRAQYPKLRADRSELERLLKIGREKALARSEPCIKRVRELCGLF